MTIGRSAYCRLVDEDEITAIYEYACSNRSYGDYDKDMNTFDGILMIDKSCFVKAEIHEKIKRRPSGRKVKVVKRIINRVDIWPHLKSGKIKVENCAACIEIIGDDEFGIGILALMLLRILFDKYQEDDTIPKTAGFIQ